MSEVMTDYREAILSNLRARKNRRAIFSRIFFSLVDPKDHEAGSLLIARAAVREALRALIREGLVEEKMVLYVLYYELKEKPENV